MSISPPIRAGYHCLLDPHISAYSSRASKPIQATHGIHSSIGSLFGRILQPIGATFWSLLEPHFAANPDHSYSLSYLMPRTESSPDSFHDPAGKKKRMNTLWIRLYCGMIIFICMRMYDLNAFFVDIFFWLCIPMLHHISGYGSP